MRLESDYDKLSRAKRVPGTRKCLESTDIELKQTSAELYDPVAI